MQVAVFLVSLRNSAEEALTPQDRGRVSPSRSAAAPHPCLLGTCEDTQVSAASTVIHRNENVSTEALPCLSPWFLLCSRCDSMCHSALQIAKCHRNTSFI